MLIRVISKINSGLCTQTVQQAIDECSVNGGGIVRFEKGVYVLGTVFLKSNVTIEIPEGTKILGAESYYDYAQEEKNRLSYLSRFVTYIFSPVYVRRLGL